MTSDEEVKVCAKIAGMLVAEGWEYKSAVKQAVNIYKETVEIHKKYVKDSDK